MDIPSKLQLPHAMQSSEGEDLQFVGIQKDGDGSIVDRCHCHIGTELSVLYVETVFFAQSHELLVQGNGNVWLSCAYEAGAIALLAIGK